MPTSGDILTYHPEPTSMQPAGEMFLGLEEGKVLFDPATRSLWTVDRVSDWPAGVAAKPLIPNIPARLQGHHEVAPPPQIRAVHLKRIIGNLEVQLNYWQNGDNGDGSSLHNIYLTEMSGSRVAGMSIHDVWGNMTGPAIEVDNGRELTHPPTMPAEKAFAILDELKRLVPMEKPI